MTGASPGGALAVDGGTPVRAAPYATGRGLLLWGEEEEAAAVDVIRSRRLFRYGAEGPSRCDELEAALGRRVGSPHVLCTSSGTAALTAALVGLGMPAGAEVIVPAVTFVACANAVVCARGIPVTVEVDDTLMLDPGAVEQAITDRTFAIMVVHLGNVAADLDPLVELARRHGLVLLEDAAQSLGVSHRGRPVGSVGDAGVTSFQTEKNVTVGEGGAVFCRDAEVFGRAARFHDQGGQFTTNRGGDRGAGSEPTTGSNLRMTEIAAAMGLVQLQRLDDLIERLRAAGSAIVAQADPSLVWRRIPDPAGAAGDPTLFCADRMAARRVVGALVAEGVPAHTMYGGQVLSNMPALRAGRTPWGQEWTPPPRCRVSEQLLGRSVTIGLSPTMTDRDVADVGEALAKVGAAGLLGGGDR